MTRRFAWDDEKAKANFRKHGITFDDAVKAFDDLDRVEYEDDERSEERRQMLGLWRGVVVLFVVYVQRELNKEGVAVEVIRIISARKATPRERRRYERERF